MSRIATPASASPSIAINGKDSVGTAAAGGPDIAVAVAVGGASVAVGVGVAGIVDLDSARCVREILIAEMQESAARRFGRTSYFAPAPGAVSAIRYRCRKRIVE